MKKVLTSLVTVKCTCLQCCTLCFNVVAKLNATLGVDLNGHPLDTAKDGETGTPVFETVLWTMSYLMSGLLQRNQCLWNVLVRVTRRTKAMYW